MNKKRKRKENPEKNRKTKKKEILMTSYYFIWNKESDWRFDSLFFVNNFKVIANL